MFGVQERPLINMASNKSDRDPKYDKLPGEFYDRDNSVLWNIWTSEEIIEQCKEFEFREDDVILATFPKSGTTLVQEIVWLIHNNIDFDRSREKPIHVRVPFLELQILEDDGFESRNHIQVLGEIKTGPRLIKTHLPYRYIAKGIEKAKCRVINVFRNPKDTLVSYFHFYRGLDDYGPWTGDWATFFQMFLEGHTVAGDWFDVTSEWWFARNRERQLVLFFEDILANPAQKIEEIINFCGLPKLEADKVQTIVEHTRFEKMRANPSTNYSQMPGVNYQFMRKGQVGDWKTLFTVAQNELFDKVYAQKMTGDHIPFRYQ